MITSKNGIAGIALTVAAALSLSGCLGPQNTKITQLQSQLNQRDQQLEQLHSSMEEKDQALQEYQEKLDEQSGLAQMAEKRAIDSETQLQDSLSMARKMPLLPPEASAGQCYARVFRPPVYEKVAEQVLKEEASERIEVIPARYEWVEQKVLVKEASKRMEAVPAQYDSVEEKVLVREAHTMWKKGSGLIEKIDEATGEVMCMVEVPAQYRTIKKQVTIKPATVKEIEIPAEYSTIKVRKLVSPAQSKRIAIPAKYNKITKRVKVSEGIMEWRQVLCETNASTDIVGRIQTALRDSGHSPGPIDGVIGQQTQAAISSFQDNKGLMQGGLTYETIQALGIQVR